MTLVSGFLAAPLSLGGRPLLSGQVVIVTGAAQGIGAAVALAAAHTGARVAVCDRDADGLEATAAQLEQLGAGSVVAELDVRDGPATARFAADVRAAAGRIDIVVNNAGGGFKAAFLDLSDGGQDALVRENFTSVTNFVRAAAPLMTGGGSIVNVTSIEAHRAAPGYAVYTAMKAAVTNLTRTLALELADRRIRVNCVAPDAIPTPGVGDLGQDDFSTPLGGGGHVDDVAAAVLFLASDLARFVTGTTIHVDGGNWAAGGWRRLPSGDWAP
jgi:NAD(P)-dependent dehydrogenase (short-subunit alcohol dehydrogenase family)